MLLLQGIMQSDPVEAGMITSTYSYSIPLNKITLVSDNVLSTFMNRLCNLRPQMDYKAFIIS